MAKAKYILQGLDPKDNHEDLIKELLNPSHQYDEVVIYSAFNRLDSVEALKKELTAYGSKVKAVIGIRNGSTSKQSLEALFETGVDLYVVDTGSQMVLFHPKTYIGINYSKNFAKVVIGSANFTPGGFRRNIENSCILDLNLCDASDRAFIKKVKDDENTLITTFDADNVIHVTSKGIIGDLFNEGRIVDEAAVRHITPVGADKGEKKIVKRMKLHSKKSSSNSRKKRTAPKAGAVILDATKPAGLLEVWKSKPLSERDLTIPTGAATNPTGSMLLKKGLYDIDFQSYFRNDVFTNLKWKRGPIPKNYYEYANAKFYFIIDGIEYPAHTLKIQYDTRTTTTSYKQRNGNTHLHWGDAKSLIQNRNLLGETMYLYRIVGKDDEFVIEIKETDED